MHCWLLLVFLLYFPGLIVAPSDQEILEEELNQLQTQIQHLDINPSTSADQPGTSHRSRNNRRKTVRIPRNRRYGASASGAKYSSVYYNAYDMPLAKWWNGGVGKLAPSLHGAVMFKGAKWPREGREFEFDVDELWDSVIKEGEPRMHSNKLRMSKYMGKTRMSPDEIRGFVDEMRNTRYGKNDYHLTKRNCNHFCKELLKKTTGRNLPKRYNRLSRFWGKMGLNRIRALG